MSNWVGQKTEYQQSCILDVQKRIRKAKTNLPDSSFIQEPQTTAQTQDTALPTSYYGVILSPISCFANFSRSVQFLSKISPCACFIGFISRFARFELRRCRINSWKFTDWSFYLRATPLEDAIFFRFLFSIDRDVSSVDVRCEIRCVNDKYRCESILQS